MDYELVAANVRASYREVWPKYRQDDEVEVTTENHQHYSSILREISSSFDRPISVLDVGCGTGRYFHCLQNAGQLVGIDVSPDMLKAAESPVRESQITAEEIQLICDNIFLISFPPASFDFIYSVGMFGYGCPLTLALCNRFYDWLKPAGRLFFNVLDFRTLSRRRRIRKRLGRILYHLLPSQMKKRLDDRDHWLPFFGVTRKELQSLMRQSAFPRFAISSHICDSALWRGALLECSATKQDRSGGLLRSAVR